MATLSTSQIQQILQQAGWPQADWPLAEGIIGAESGGDPNVVAWGSGSTVLADSEGWPPPVSGYDEAAVGLFQNLISPATAVTPQAIQQLQNPLYNAQVALGKLDQSGTFPWEGDSYIASVGGPVGPGAVATSPPTTTTNYNVTNTSGSATASTATAQLASANLPGWLNTALSIFGSGGNPASIAVPAGEAAGKAAAKGENPLSALGGDLGSFFSGFLQLSTLEGWVIRLFEIIAGGFLFAFGLYALFQALAGKSNLSDISTPKVVPIPV